MRGTERIGGKATVCSVVFLADVLEALWWTRHRARSEKVLEEGLKDKQDIASDLDGVYLVKEEVRPILSFIQLILDLNGKV